MSKLFRDMASANLPVLPDQFHLLGVVSELMRGCSGMRCVSGGSRGAIAGGQCESAEFLKFTSHGFALEFSKTTAVSNSIPAEERIFALHLWPCASILAQFIWRKRQFFANKRVVEIGCGGTGLPGITAAKCGASFVTFSDAPCNPIVENLLHQNCRENSVINYKFRGLDWRDEHNNSDLHEIVPFDILLASDCFYDPSVFEPCLNTINRLLRISNSNVDDESETPLKCPCCIVAYQERNSDWTIVPLLNRLNLKCELIEPNSFHAECIQSTRQIQRDSSVRFPQHLPPRVPRSRAGANGAFKKDYSPLKWTEFFDRKQLISVSDTDSFNVYIKGTGPVVFYLLHGGGYSGLTWSCFAQEISELVDCTIVAPDLRGHGDTSTSNESDLSTETQVCDIKAVFNKLFAEDDAKLVFLMGHSMGGALAVHTALADVQGLCALCVIDVVEGSALDALRGMQTFLRNRPDRFPSVQNAVEWCVRSGTVRNVRSARVSMPAQLRPLIIAESDSKCTTPDVNTSSSSTSNASGDSASTLSTLQEDANGSSKSENTAISEAGDTPSSGSSSSTPQTWRIDLMKTEPHWRGWFEGLSSKFLSVPVPKLLLLAGVDRLDKDLTVGQMQGKFQMIVLPKVGHAVHEDSPNKVADAVAHFCIRNKFCTAKKEFTPVFPGC